MNPVRIAIVIAFLFIAAAQADESYEIYADPDSGLAFLWFPTRSLESMDIRLGHVHHPSLFPNVNIRNLSARATPAPEGSLSYQFQLATLTEIRIRVHEKSAAEVVGPRRSYKLQYISPDATDPFSLNVRSRVSKPRIAHGSSEAELQRLIGAIDHGAPKFSEPRVDGSGLILRAFENSEGVLLLQLNLNNPHAAYISDKTRNQHNSFFVGTRAKRPFFELSELSSRWQLDRNQTRVGWQLPNSEGSFDRDWAQVQLDWNNDELLLNTGSPLLNQLLEQPVQDHNFFRLPAAEENALETQLIDGERQIIHLREDLRQPWGLYLIPQSGQLIYLDRALYANNRNEALRYNAWIKRPGSLWLPVKITALQEHHFNSPESGDQIFHFQTFHLPKTLRLVVLKSTTDGTVHAHITQGTPSNPNQKSGLSASLVSLPLKPSQFKSFGLEVHCETALTGHYRPSTPESLTGLFK